MSIAATRPDTKTMPDPFDFLDSRSLFSEQEQQVQDSVARFVDEQALPIIADCFEQGRFPAELVPAMAELGMFGSNLEGYGCAGLNAVCYGLICQEMERGDSALRSLVSVQSSLVMYAIHSFGSEQQKQRWLPAMARGEALGCFGLTESQGGSDPSNLKTRARRDGTDWLINGSKMWITNGSIADVAVIWARTEDGVQGFLVEKDTPGFSSERIQHKMSLRASVTSALFLDQVRLPADSVLPAVSSMRGPLSCLNQARYGICWGPLGAAQACLAEALAYAGERELFGRPLTHTQLVQSRLADMTRRLSGARLQALRLAQLKDQGQLDPAQISLVKWNNVRMALDIARDCRDLLGGAGISLDHVAIRHLLNLESVITYEGTESIHQLVVGKEMTGVAAF
jgi:glutaryl-CoA dehydrogenase